MQKAYVRIYWENYPSERTALNETNLNRMDAAIDEIDNRVITLDTTKLDASVANGFITGISFDYETGILTVTFKDGSAYNIDLGVSKVITNFTFDRDTQSLVLTLQDGTQEYISLSSFITETEFASSPTISTVVAGGVVTSSLREGSVGEQHLRPNYLADIRISEANAAASAASADENMTLSESYAHGNTGIRPNENEDNASYYSDLSRGYSVFADEARQQAEALVEVATERLTGLRVRVDPDDGCLYYNIESGIVLRVDSETGNLMYSVTTD